MKRSTIILFAAIAIVAIMILIPLSKYNTLVTKQENVSEQWGQVMNVYQRRADLLPNLVNTVKGAANFEQSTLTDIAEARASIGQLKVDANTFKDPKALEAFMQNQDRLSGSIGRLMMQAENYPELKATQGFQDLMVQIEGSENRISVERKKYNESVKDYNTYIRQLPQSLFSGIMGFDKVPYYEGNKGQNIQETPKVSF